MIIQHGNAEKVYRGRRFVAVADVISSNTRGVVCTVLDGVYR